MVKKKSRGRVTSVVVLSPTDHGLSKGGGTKQSLAGATSKNHLASSMALLCAMQRPSTRLQQTLEVPMSDFSEVGLGGKFSLEPDPF
jgi:hypothetical protein